MDSILMLILAKIQDERFISDMYNKEYLYFKSLKYFRSNKEDPSGRLDSKELNLKNVQLKYLSIKTGTKDIEISKIFSDFNAQYMEHLSSPKINCCSLYSFTIEPDNPNVNIDSRILDMGNMMLIIHNVTAFFKILDESNERNNYKYSRKFVTYYKPETYDGALILHHKDQAFDYQKEYQILIAPTDKKPIKIELPGLREISTILDIESLK
ncbi:hypothetical protein ACFLU5_16275 [Bacteroidota bacterium]